MRYLVMLLLFVVTSQNLTIAQTDEAKKVLNKLIDYSLENNFKPAAELILFDANGQSIDKLRSFDWNNSEEQKEVIRTCKKIRAYIKFADEFEILDSGEISADNSGISIELKLLSSGKETVYEFVFVSVNDKILLKQIN